MGERREVRIGAAAGDFAGNAVHTTKYTALTFLPMNLMAQFHRLANVYFLSIAVLNWVPQLNVFGKEISMLPLLFVLAVTALKDGYEDYRRRVADRREVTRRTRSRRKEWESGV